MEHRSKAYSLRGSGVDKPEDFMPENVSEEKGSSLYQRTRTDV